MRRWARSAPSAIAQQEADGEGGAHARQRAARAPTRASRCAAATSSRSALTDVDELGAGALDLRANARRAAGAGLQPSLSAAIGRPPGGRVGGPGRPDAAAHPCAWASAVTLAVELLAWLSSMSCWRALRMPRAGARGRCRSRRPRGSRRPPARARPPSHPAAPAARRAPRRGRVAHQHEGHEDGDARHVQAHGARVLAQLHARQLDVLASPAC